MKLVTRLRGFSLSSSSNSSTPSGGGGGGGTGTNGSQSSSSTTALSTTSTQIFVGDKQRRRSSRGSSGNISSPSSDRESDEDIPSMQRIVRDRSRSVCMPVLTSSQLRHLHRRASHHV